MVEEHLAINLRMCKVMMPLMVLHHKNALNQVRAAHQQVEITVPFLMKEVSHFQNIIIIYRRSPAKYIFIL